METQYDAHKEAKNNEGSEVIETVCALVSAYVSNNTVPTPELVSLIEDVHMAVLSISGADSDSSTRSLDKNLTPAVPINRSVQPDYIACLECGQRFKSLKKHLRTHHDQSPEEYIKKWGLPSDYPMVCPDYAKHRSKLAKKIGLGKR